MNKLFKNLNKSGLVGFIAKRNLRIFGLVALILFVAGAFIAAGGDIFSIISGISLATIAPISLAIPDGEWSEEEKKVLDSQAKHFSEQLNKYFSDEMSREKLYEYIQSKLSENGFDESRIKKFEKAIKELENQINKYKNAVEKEDNTLAGKIVEQIKSETDANNVRELKDYLKSNPEFKNKTLILKDAIMTTDMTGTIGTTNMDRTVGWQFARRLAFLPYLRSVTEMSDKGIFGYTEGSYTSNAGYVGEATNTLDGDEASAIERTRKYAKISAWQTVSVETFEDLSDFARGLVEQLRYGALLFADKEIYNGTGADGNAATERRIYGILPAATPFNSSTYANLIEKANIADLFSAVQNQINSIDGAPLMANIAWMNNVDIFKARRLKDASGQPLFNYDFFGNPTIGGMRVIDSSLIPANSMLMADSDCIELRMKRNMELKIGQILTDDVKNDTQSAILFARLQVLIRERDKPGVVKVTDINAAIDAINIV